MRLLSFYQLWLDDLFPRAKFADGLAIIEKLGHSKRMQTMRREWIDEGKPRDRFADGWAVSGQVAKQQQPELHRRSSKSNEDSSEHPNIDGALESNSTSTVELEEPDPVNSQSLQWHTEGVQHDTPHDESLFISDGEEDDQPPEDDLDALLAEDVQKDFSRKIDRDGKDSVKQAAVADDFDDEIEALAGMEDMW